MPDPKGIKPTLTLRTVGCVVRLNMSAKFSDGSYLLSQNPEYDGPSMLGKCSDRHWVDFYIAQVETSGENPCEGEYIFPAGTLSENRKKYIEVTVHISLLDQTSWTGKCIFHQDQAGENAGAEVWVVEG